MVDQGGGEHADAPDPLLDADSVLGVHVVRHPDPAWRARELLDEIGGEIVIDVDHVQRAFAARVDAARVEPVVLTDSERAELVEAARSGSPVGPVQITDTKAEELRSLARELALVERIRVETESGVVGTLRRRLSGSTGVSVHPDAIRAAAASVLGATATVAERERALDELGPRPAPLAAPGSAGAAAPRIEELPFAPEPVSARRRMVVPAGIAVVALATALVAVAGVPAVPWLLLAAGLLGACAATIRARRDARDPGRTPAPLAGETDPVPGITEHEWLIQRAQLEAARDRAVEEARSARVQWESLAGPGADPADLDAVLRRHDPQYDLVGAAAKASPAVRAARAVHEEVRSRWRAEWQALGYDEPPEPADIETHLDAMSAPATGDVVVSAASARARLAAADAWAEACAVIDRPILLVQPENWLPASTLAAMVNTLPAGAEVIIVTRG